MTLTLLFSEGCGACGDEASLTHPKQMFTPEIHPWTLVLALK